MSIWFTSATISELDTLCRQSMVSHLDIEFTEIGDDFISARMPVDHRTHQPDGLLHGGASVALAETLGSVAANMCIDREKKICVGLSINASHIRAVRTGFVFGTTKPIHLGASTQIWEIRVLNEKKSLISIVRLTLAVLERKG